MNEMRNRDISIEENNKKKKLNLALLLSKYNYMKLLIPSSPDLKNQIKDER